MRLRNLAAFAIAALMALPVAAQEQTGAIQGVVKDSQGGSVPGALVEANNGRGQVMVYLTGRPTSLTGRPSVTTATNSASLIGWQA